jgi:hypothetical protein
VLCGSYHKITCTLHESLSSGHLWYRAQYHIFLGTLIKINLPCTNLRNMLSCKNIPRDSWLFLPYVKLFHAAGTICCPLIVVNVNPQSFYCSKLLRMGTTSLSSLAKENGLRIQNDHTANQGNFGGLRRGSLSSYRFWISDNCMFVYLCLWLHESEPHCSRTLYWHNWHCSM